MTDDNVPVTKKDIQMLFEALMMLDKKVDDSEERLEAKIKDSENCTAILIEGLRHDVLGSKQDQVSAHENKLERHTKTLNNHEKRIDNLETQTVLG